MMLQLIDDVNKALDMECYYSALTLALTFADMDADMPLLSAESATGAMNLMKSHIC